MVKGAKMELREITDIIEGDFVIARRGYGYIRRRDGKPLIFNSEAIDEGKQELPKAWLNRRVIIKSLTWSELLVEVLNDD